MKYLKYLLLIIIFIAPVVVFAGFDPLNIAQSMGLPSGEGKESPAAVAVAIVNIALSFLGIVTLIIVLWGGFLFLFARGNTEQTSKGKKVLLIGIIGIGIVLASYGISYFVFNQLSEVTGGEGSGYAPGGQEGFKCKQAGGACGSCASEFRLGAYDCPSLTMCCRNTTTGCVATEGHCEWSTTQYCNEGDYSGKLDCPIGRICCK